MDTLGAIALGISGFSALGLSRGGAFVAGMRNATRRALGVIGILVLVLGAFGVVAVGEDIPAAVTVFALAGCALGSIAILIEIPKSVTYLFPDSWEHIGSYKYWRDVGGIEIVLGPLGGYDEHREHSQSMKLSNRCGQDLSFEGATLQARDCERSARIAFRTDGAKKIRDGDELDLQLNWRLGFPIREAYADGARVTLKLATGESKQEVAVAFRHPSSPPNKRLQRARFGSE